MLPFLSLPRFTNVWMPLMRYQDHSRGAQWSRSCDNLLFRCWRAVEAGAGSDWNCIRLVAGLCGSYSACGFHSSLIREDKPSRSSGGDQWSNHCSAFHVTPCAFFCSLLLGSNILHLITVKHDTTSSKFMM